MKYILRGGIACVFALISCGAKKNLNPETSKNEILKHLNANKSGNDFTYNLAKEILVGADDSNTYLPLIENKKIGIVTNQSGILKNGGHLVDYLLENKINIQTIFSPEHGFRGTADAGEHVIDGKDAKTGLSIISLYGDNKKPKQEQLAGIEIMIFDLQDVGARFYTYISTLHYVMEACSENNIQLIILDRPNPNGSIVDGPILEKEFKSFVGMHEIPILHGMTIGEYAQMINGEKCLENGMICKLDIVKCFNYSHNMFYDLPVKPSPNLPNSQAVNLYPSLCLFEGTNVSVGRGTEKQFQVYGSPFLLSNDFEFTPIPNFGAKDPVYKNQICYGEDLSKINKINKLELKWLIKAYEQTQDKSVFFNSFFTKLVGTKKLQQQIETGLSEVEIRKSWKKGLQEFKKIRAKYL
ncbi:MAG: DUF1343 domain-containing protein, partial [Flavobacterium sp.]|nr:DUF1343 domain-containing protein [Flavobacterium sp.]